MGPLGALVITDKGIVNAGIAKKVVDGIEATSIDVELYSEVNPNPRDHDCNKGVEVARERIDRSDRGNSEKHAKIAGILGVKLEGKTSTEAAEEGVKKSEC